MQSLRCDLSDGFYATVKKTPFETQERKRRRDYVLQLYGNNGGDKPISTKTVPWPANEDSPTEVVFSDEDSILRIKNSLTVVAIPIKRNNLNFTKKEDDGGCKKFKSFTSGLPESDSSNIIAAIRSVSTSPDSKNEWKSLQKLLVPGSPAVPLPEQEALISALSHIKESKNIQNICRTVLESKILGFRKQNDIAKICINNGLIEIIIADLNQGSYCEEVKTAVLKHISSLKETEGIPLLESVLRVGFSPERLAITAKTITVSGAAQLFKWLTLIYSDYRKAAIHGQALSLFSALLDAVGSQLVLEDPQTLSECVEFIADFAAFTDESSKLHVYLNILEKMEHKLPDVDPVFLLQKLQIQPRKVIW